MTDVVQRPPLASVALLVHGTRVVLERSSPLGRVSVIESPDVPLSSGMTDAADRLLMIRGWQTVTLLVKNGAVTPDEVRRLREFCDALSFDVAWFPGIRADDASIYNQLPAPWYFEGVRALLGEDRAAFIAGYPFDIRPATDDRPYFQNFFRWPVLTEAWGARDRGGMALPEAGYLLLAGTLVQALVAGLLLIILPLALFAPLTHSSRRLRRRVFGYFTGIGLAFLFVEIALLQKPVLPVHHPTVALSLVLAIFLLGAGVGSAWTSRVPRRGAGPCSSWRSPASRCSAPSTAPCSTCRLARSPADRRPAGRCSRSISDSAPCCGSPSRCTCSCPRRFRSGARPDEAAGST